LGLGLEVAPLFLGEHQRIAPAAADGLGQLGGRGGADPPERLVELGLELGGADVVEVEHQGLDAGDQGAGGVFQHQAALPRLLEGAGQLPDRSPLEPCCPELHPSKPSAVFAKA